jgi:hypothetical protein
MTSREHARRLMLILLSTPPAPAAAEEPDERAGEPTDERQATEGRDDSTDGDERRTSRLADALILT